MTKPRPAILVVDDDLDTRRNLADILEDLGYDVVTAHDGPSALEEVGRRAFDVVLFDLKMPGMDGVELYREIRRRSAGTVGILVSAFTSAATRDEALAAGAWHVLAKPVNFGRLLALVDEALGQPLLLVVDDDEDLCKVLWDLLRDRGFRVSLAHDEAEAARRLAARRYDVVLIDMALPDSDGARVNRCVHAANPQARTVLITGRRRETEELIAQALKEGADAVCYKPFDVPRLIETLSRLSAGRGQAAK